MSLNLIDFADEISFSQLGGHRIYTVGKQFSGLSPHVFRRMLRKAGAEAQRYPTRGTDLIVVGDNPPISGVLRVLMKYTDEACPPLVNADAFIARFEYALGELEVAKGVTLKRHRDVKNRAKVSPTGTMLHS